MSAHTYWASIGRNTRNGGTLSDADWARFMARLRDDIVQSCGGTIITSVTGPGEWNGDSEDSHLILFTIAPEYVAPLRHRLQWLANLYLQEAIGLVGGPGDTLIYAT